jgi:hypothetical protein
MRRPEKIKPGSYRAVSQLNDEPESVPFILLKKSLQYSLRKPIYE